MERTFLHNGRGWYFEAGVIMARLRRADIQRKGKEWKTWNFPCPQREES
jgi:hypothetical protein